VSLVRKFTKIAAEQVRRLPPSAKPHIRKLCDEILEDPTIGKSLKGDLVGYYSLRHAHYRIIYTHDVRQKLIIIEYVGLRRSIYQLFAELQKLRG
jgi:mRNA interferase RelE/StbE